MTSFPLTFSKNEFFYTQWKKVVFSPISCKKEPFFTRYKHFQRDMLLLSYLASLDKNLAHNFKRRLLDLETIIYKVTFYPISCKKALINTRIG